MNGKQLKNSILQWAIQGKLVPQDPNDEPASVLLERIRAEKERLIKEKKIKRPKNESVIFKGEDNSYYEKFTNGTVKCIDDKIPFEIPIGWSLCRLNDLALYRKGPFGSSLTKSMFVPKCDSSVKVYEQKNAIQKDYRLGDYYISQDKFNDMQSFIVEPGELIVSCAGTIGETYCLPDEAPTGIINQALMRVKLYDKQLNPYWQLYFRYILINESQMKGAGSAIKNIPPFEYLKSIIVVLPPLAEQMKIVEALQQLNILSENYDKLQTELNKLNLGIYDKIRKSILQEVIQGKLVPQNPNDEPASVLLERIHAEKERLIKEKKIKRDKNESVIFKGEDNSYYEKFANGTEKCIDEEIPFKIPNNWSWIRLCHVAEIARGGSPRPIKDYITESHDGINWIKIGDTEKGGKYINHTNEKIKPEGLSKSRLVHQGDFLLTNSMSFGRPYITNIEGCIHDGWLVISPLKESYIQDFLYSLLSSSFAYNQFAGKVTGAVVKNLNSDKVSNAIFPLPPIKEQMRIVLQLNDLTKYLK
jgi:type I restriction enzyme S subunit